MILTWNGGVPNGSIKTSRANSASIPTKAASSQAGTITFRRTLLFRFPVAERAKASPECRRGAPRRARRRGLSVTSTTPSSLPALPLPAPLRAGPRNARAITRIASAHHITPLLVGRGGVTGCQDAANTAPSQPIRARDLSGSRGGRDRRAVARSRPPRGTRVSVRWTAPQGSG